METLNLIRFIAGTVLISLGILIFLVEIFGVFKFKYTLEKDIDAQYALVSHEIVEEAASLVGKEDL